MINLIITSFWGKIDACLYYFTLSDPVSGCLTPGRLHDEPEQKPEPHSCQCLAKLLQNPQRKPAAVQDLRLRSHTGVGGSLHFDLAGSPELFYFGRLYSRDKMLCFSVTLTV